MTKKIITITISLFVLFFLIINGCGKTDLNLVGNWESDPYIGFTRDGKQEKSGVGSSKAEFFNDKTVIMSFAGQGNWSILNNGSVKIAFKDGGIMLGTLKQGNLILFTGNDELGLRFKKKK